MRRAVRTLIGQKSAQRIRIGLCGQTFLLQHIRILSTGQMASLASCRHVEAAMTCTRHVFERRGSVHGAWPLELVGSYNCKDLEELAK